MAHDSSNPPAPLPADFLAGAKDALADMAPDAAAAMIGTYCYLRAKATIYFRKGPEAYRRDDFFHVPRSEWGAGELAGLERGFRQLVDWKGLTPATAFEGIDLGDLYRMMEVGHFRLDAFTAARADAGTWIGTATLLHRMDARRLRLHYKFGNPARSSTADAPSAPKKTSFLGRLSPWRRKAAPRPEAVASPQETFGYTADDPIPCWEPFGEVVYLKGLRCPNGHPFTFHRYGSMDGTCSDPSTHRALVPAAPGETPHCIVDLYQLECREGEHACKLYFDMYHPQAANQPAPKGLSRAAQSEG